MNFRKDPTWKERIHFSCMHSIPALLLYFDPVSSDTEGFWKLLLRGRQSATPFPKDRIFQHHQG
ncbi:hypothetical protein BDV27DRAFT_121879 [Aspergillus caelatus]|uniref:Uncharacterized protein n=1 Tax=Aspergillus caelatus TaxID=61420 RepID=A0A5N7AHQ0_9EURO|nr:uncharacterized protein BDV27DRAFT_121879 [Aspergillus caelatus]KAE8368728.1 hypothetical protein BDV27DRAFT_121879 [Aspergillus caelatus]